MISGKGSVFATATLFTLVAARPVLGHGDVMRIGSSRPAGGQLLISSEFDFDLDVHLTAVATVGNRTLYTAIIPSFAWILEPKEGTHFPLDESIAVSISVVDPVEPPAALRIGDRLLDVPGESAVLGRFSRDPEAHIHPEWQLVLMNGVVGYHRISFKLSTNARGYADSRVYSLRLTNAEAEATRTPTATPTATPSLLDVPTHTATATATAARSQTAGPTAALSPTPTRVPSEIPTPPILCAGDCSADGAVTINEIILAIGLGLGAGSLENCRAADRDGNGAITVDELIAAIRSALNGCGSDGPGEPGGGP